MQWRSRDEDERVCVALDDDFVVYHRPSGATHFLNSEAHALMVDVLSIPRDLQSIVSFFTDHESDAEAAVISEQMERLLARLEYLGLIESV